KCFSPSCFPKTREIQLFTKVLLHSLKREFLSKPNFTLIYFSKNKPRLKRLKRGPIYRIFI
ncbi:hypothetical protein, partial [Empedobacter sp. UBA3239]|uniref:hypothetical protein n=1 Tax=Empedobacter sp. UBA3239 TaxID=1946434 RepID=UPI0025C1F3F4